MYSDGGPIFLYKKYENEGLFATTFKEGVMQMENKQTNSSQNFLFTPFGHQNISGPLFDMKLIMFKSHRPAQNNMQT